MKHSLSSHLCVYIFLLSLKANGASMIDESAINAMSGFVGVEGGHYYGRAFSVFLQRTTKWTKSLPEGTKCNNHGPRCSLGLLCVGPTEDDKVCSRPSALKEYCDDKYFPCEANLQCVQNQCNFANKEGSICREDKPCVDGLTCHHGVCHDLTKRDDLCDGLTLLCKNGMICTLGFCKEPRIANQECSLWHPCRTDLLCLNGKCRPLLVEALGTSCLKSEQCKGNLACINKKCSDNHCGSSGFSCGKFQICKNMHCMEKRNDMETCTAKGECKSGLCLGRPGICIPKRKRGETCVTGYLGCEQNLRCANGICQDVRFLSEPCKTNYQCWGTLICSKQGCRTRIPLGGKCRTKEKCEPGLTCHEGKCHQVQNKVGGSCSSTVVCKTSSNLKCVEGKCKKAILEGQSCSRHVDCQDHLYCRKGKCKKHESVGARCDSEYLCDPNLMCHNNICAVIQKEFQVCNKYMACGVGLYCNEKQICQKLRNEGDRCSTRAKCAPLLTCVFGKCKRVRNNGESCKNTEECETTAVCIQNRCTLAKVLGERCNRSPDNCARWLVCNKYEKCVVGNGIGYSCDDENKFCAKGRFCLFKGTSDTTTGSLAQGRCASKFNIGQPCETGSIICRDGLTCVNGICRTKDYFVSSSSETCSFNDPCTPSRTMSAPKEGSVRDSCGRLFYVDKYCTLYDSSQICHYKDACNRQQIWAPKDGLLHDSCGSSFYVDRYCNLHRK